jgi:type II secretory ATPase GspE/PulE/Tfp pilus assembly ATPase PilB-like protein
MLGEIRDPATASLAFQAALSGHRLVCTLHAATCGGAVARLLDMGIEPYQMTSALFGVLAQRWLRKTTGGRVPVAEFAAIDQSARQAVLSRSDATMLQEVFARQSGFRGMRDVATDLVNQSVVDSDEVRRALGEP